MVCCYESQILEFSGRNLDCVLRVAMKSKGNTHPVYRIMVEKSGESIREAVFITGELRLNYSKNVKGKDSVLTKFNLITKCS